MRSSDLPEVKSIHLFESMEDSRFEILLNAAYLQTFPAQVDLIREGDPADFLHVVLDGRVELFAQSNGRETTMAMVPPRWYFYIGGCLERRCLFDVGTDKPEITNSDDPV